MEDNVLTSSGVSSILILTVLTVFLFLFLGLAALSWSTHSRYGHHSKQLRNTSCSRNICGSQGSLLGGFSLGILFFSFIICIHDPVSVYRSGVQDFLCLV